MVPIMIIFTLTFFVEIFTDKSTSIKSIVEVASSKTGKSATVNFIRKKVSKKKFRFTDHGFNLDLTYIDRDIIAMGLPCNGFLTGLYRNNMADVQNFLERFHHRKHKVYNLCKETQYHPSRFNYSYAYYPFPDHKPCPFQMIDQFSPTQAITWVQRKETSLPFTVRQAKVALAR